MARRNSWNTSEDISDRDISIDDLRPLPSRRKRSSAWTDFSEDYTLDDLYPTSSGRGKKSVGFNGIPPLVIYIVGGIILIALVIFLIMNGGDIINAIGTGISSLVEIILSVLFTAALCWGSLVFAFGRRMAPSTKTMLFVIILIVAFFGIFIPDLQSLLIGVTVVSFLVKIFSSR